MAMSKMMKVLTFENPREFNSSFLNIRVADIHARHDVVSSPSMAEASRGFGQSGRVIERGEHWESIYSASPFSQVSWYEREPATSLRLIEEIAAGPSAAVIDIGAGASSLVDRLLAGGFRDVTVLDISRRALDEVRRRLGERALPVTFIVQDVLRWAPDRQYDIWHDRAVFHFLTEPSEREAYVDLAARSIRSGGVLVVATFAADGPTHCSGLPVDALFGP